MLQPDLLGTSPDAYSADSPPASPDKPRSRAVLGEGSGSRTSLAILTCSAVVAIFAAAGSNATIALGLSYTIVQALAFLLIERARAEAQSGRHNAGSVIYSANGSLTQPSSAASGEGSTVAVIRDVATASALCTAIAALTLESFTFGGLGYWGIFGQVLGDQWVFWNGILGVIYAIVTVLVHVAVGVGILVLVSPSSSSSLKHQQPNPHLRGMAEAPAEPCRSIRATSNAKVLTFWYSRSKDKVHLQPPSSLCRPQYCLNSLSALRSADCGSPHYAPPPPTPSSMKRTICPAAVRWGRECGSVGY